MELKKFISLISAAAITASAFSPLGVYAESEDAAVTNETEVSQGVSEDNSGKTTSEEEELVVPAAYDTSDAGENSAETEKDVSNESMPKATLRPEPNDGAVEVTAEPQLSSDVQLAAESNWNAYTAAYDSDGRLTAIYKTSDIVPSDADTSINYEMLKTFVWDDNGAPYINSNEVIFKKDDYRCIQNNDGEGYSVMVYLDDIKSKYVSYKLSSDLKIYVNGKEYTHTIEAAEQFITSNFLGNVTLKDIPNAESGETDGIYDEIDIQYFLDGCVDEVTEGDYGRYYICFDEIYRRTLVLDEYKTYSIKLNGKEISPSELKQGDILSIAYDVDGGWDYYYSDDYEIYVSRETKRLNVTDVSDDDSNQKITAADGRTYVTAYENAANMSAAKEYDVSFDIFGKIAYAKEVTSPVQYAILENLYATNGGIDYYADIITASGEKKSYPVTRADYDAFIYILMADPEKFDTDEKLLNRQEPQDRVIEYTINSKGELNVKRTVSPWRFEGEYDAESNRLDGNKLDSEVSEILNISDYRNDESRGYPAVSLSDFRDRISYKGYVFGMTSNGSYQFVIITSGIGGYHVTDSWGVYVTGEKVSTPDGYMDAVTAYVNGELKTIPIDVPDEDFSTGDVFFYTTDSDGYIDNIRKVSSTGYTYRDMFKQAIDSNFDIVNSETAEQFSGSSSKNNFAQDNGSPNMLVSGFIIDNYGLSVTMATKYDLSKNNTITAFDLGRCKEYTFANDMKVYKYDYSFGNLEKRISPAEKTDIKSARFYGSSYVDNALNFETEYENLLYEKDDNCGRAVFAVAKIVDDDITEILIMTPPSKYSGFIKKANAEVNISDIYYFDSYEEEPSILNVYKDESKGDYDKYKISQNAEIKVNGIKVSMSLDDLMNSNVVTGNKSGTIKLTDLPEKSGGKTDGIYDEIDVSYYVSGIVDSVEEKDGAYNIHFGNADGVINSENLKLDSSKKYTMTLDGKEIAPSELKQGDVLSAAYDVNADFENSGNYIVLVSRNVFEGVVTSVSNDTNALDVKYKFDNGNTYYIAHEGVARLKSGTAYNVYVDALGRIAYAEEAA